MIIERADRIIHLCEMKFSTDRYAITDNYEMKLRERMGLFRMATKTRKTLVITFVTTYGVVDGKHKVSSTVKSPWTTFSNHRNIIVTEVGLSLS